MDVAHHLKGPWSLYLCIGFLNSSLCRFGANRSNLVPPRCTLEIELLRFQLPYSKKKKNSIINSKEGGGGEGRRQKETTAASVIPCLQILLQIPGSLGAPGSVARMESTHPRSPLLPSRGSTTRAVRMFHMSHVIS